MAIYYRIQDSSRDAQALLDPANWVSRVWYDATVTCPSCQGITPESWTDECEACGGHGVRNLSEMPRRGVSACESIEDLARYFDRHAGQLGEDSVVVELEGELSDDDDFDADEHLAVLILPAAVVSVTPAAEFSELEELMA